MSTLPAIPPELSADPSTDLALDREIVARSFRDFVELAWPIVETNRFTKNWHIDAACEHLQAVSKGEIKNLLFNWPPGTSKSSVVSVLWPAWEWTQSAEERFACFSYDQQLATRDAVKMRELLRSDWYRHRWPQVIVKRDQDEKTYFENVAGGFRLSTSVGSGTVGRHPTRAIIDDPHNIKRAESEQERENVIQWYTLGLGARGAAADIGMRRVLIMQRLAERDLTGYILGAEPESWVKIILPMRYESKRMVMTPLGWNDPRKEEGELLDPVRFPEPVVKTLEKTLLAYGTAGQLQQNPAPRGGGEIKRDWWRWYDYRVALEFDIEIQSWDTALKDNTGNAKTAGLAFGRRGADIYVKDGINEQMSFPGMLSAVQNWALIHPRATKKLVEDTASGPAIVSLLHRRIPGLIPRKVPQASKLARLRAVSPLNEAGNVFLPGIKVGEVWEPAYPWVAQLVEQCALGLASQDKDLMDAYSQGVAELEPAVWRAEKEEAAEEAKKAAKEPTAAQEFQAKIDAMRKRILEPSQRRSNPYGRRR